MALSNDAVLLAEKCGTQEYDHASHLAVFIKNMFDDAGVLIKKLSAVSVSAGPGSYTGLRIGVSTAKGICHAFHIPLIAVSGLQAMVYNAMQTYNTDFFCPMMDAKRMEVYSAVYDNHVTELEKEDARILHADFCEEFLEKGSVLFFGSGAVKAQDIIHHKHAVFSPSLHQSAGSLVQPAYQKYLQKQFADTVYFEPNYIKPFYMGPGSKK